MKNILILIVLFNIGVGYTQEPTPTETHKPMAFRQISPEKKFENDVKRNVFTIYTIGGLKP
jgi:hypothetical protein